LVKGTLTWLDADTVATITHNFGLSVAEITALFPDVIVVVDTTSTGTATSANVAVANFANTVTLAKASAAGSGGTVRFGLQKWHSITR
jgi:hypothetical protein